MANDGFGTGHTYFSHTGNSNGTILGNQPIWFNTRLGVNNSNPAYRFEVQGTANATTIREGTTLLSAKYALSNTLSNYALGSTLFSNWASPISIFGSNAHSNQTPLTTYNTFSKYITSVSIFGSNAHSNNTPLTTYNTLSNWISPLSIWSSNNSSNLTPLNTFTAYSNLITPLAQWTSNALSNYTPIVSDKYWTLGSNNKILTLSNVAIGRNINVSSGITLDVFNSNSAYTTWFRGTDNNQFVIQGGTFSMAGGGTTAPSLILSDTRSNFGYCNTTFNIDFSLNPFSVPAAQIRAVSNSNFSSHLIFSNR
jgi:hypothetical protein